MADDIVRCAHCALHLFQNAADGVWYHECTAERECWGYPFYGTRTAFPEAARVFPQPQEEK